MIKISNFGRDPDVMVAIPLQFTLVKGVFTLVTLIEVVTRKSQLTSIRKKYSKYSNSNK